MSAQPFYGRCKVCLTNFRPDGTCPHKCPPKTGKPGSRRPGLSSSEGVKKAPPTGLQGLQRRIEAGFRKAYGDRPELTRWNRRGRRKSENSG